MSKNKYEYKCPFGGEQVASLTKHVKKTHPEEMEKGFKPLKEGIRQRMTQGYDPISHMKGGAKIKTKKKDADQKDQKDSSRSKKEKPNKESDATDEKSGNFLDCLDDF